MCMQTGINAILKGLSLEQKIGHMVLGRGLCRFADEVMAMIKAGRMGGIQEGIVSDNVP